MFIVIVYFGGYPLHTYPPYMCVCSWGISVLSSSDECYPGCGYLVIPGKYLENPSLNIT